MKPVFFHEEADAEFEAAIAFYDGRSSGFGGEFRREVEKAIERIQEFPRIAPAYKRTSLRRYVLRKYPYSLFFQETETAFLIIAVAHGKRRPEYWKNRTAA